jgi:hypothetical protein
LAAVSYLSGVFFLVWTHPNAEDHARLARNVLLFRVQGLGFRVDAEDNARLARNVLLFRVQGLGFRV